MGRETKCEINVKEKTGDGSHGLSLLLSTSLGISRHHVEGFIHLSVSSRTTAKMCDSPEPALNQPH